jgi:hypothetical protein
VRATLLHVSRLLLAAAVIALLALVGAFVPIGGRTVVERWNVAPSASDFAERGAREIARGWGHLWADRGESRRASSGASARPAPTRGSRGAVPARQGSSDAPVPVEHHSDDDRSALDRIVAEHAADRSARH